jgi:DNA mismatch repair protein MutS2
LDSYLRQKDSRKILQEQIITERNGRAVLLVRSECRGQLVGIVHGTSSSGATLFIEPLSTVELNNDIVSLVEQERQEIERILAGLTNEARACSAELGIGLEALSHLDLVQAKALLSHAYGGCEPRVHEDRSLRLESARHPLLVAKVAERAGEPIPPREAVPISLQVDGRKRSGHHRPNTGETVALKTAGLLSSWCRPGFVPAASASAFPCSASFQDIGDEQSIGQLVHIFSTPPNIVEMERVSKNRPRCSSTSGTGTDRRAERWHRSSALPTARRSGSPRRITDLRSPRGRYKFRLIQFQP